MLLQELTGIEFINCKLQQKEKSKVIKELTDTLVKTGFLTNPEDFIKAIETREQLETTGIGDGIAIPHARITGVKVLKVAIGISPEGIDYGSLDDKPVHIIFMIAAPEDVGKTYLQAVAKVSRLLKSNTIRQALIKANSPEKIMDIIREFDNILPETLEVQTQGGKVVYNK
ncbi:MAG: PTS sugar transporter subunit IIA [bacterium]|nr:PTS sugar transporter subunit IIA [bacterium]